MIVNWLLEAVAWLWAWICAHLPAIPVPSWLTDAPSALAGLVDKVSGFGAFLPFTVLGAVLGTLLLLATVSLVVKVVRIVASFLTAGGGSAA